ncbi:hypothetical protein PSPO01_03508, partial [Paraphaeosphaeria sporulosa]
GVQTARDDLVHEVDQRRGGVSDGSGYGQSPQRRTETATAGVESPKVALPPYTPVAVERRSVAHAPVAASLRDLRLPLASVWGDQAASARCHGALHSTPRRDEHHDNLRATNDVAHVEIASNYPAFTAASIQPYPASAMGEVPVLR